MVYTGVRAICRKSAIDLVAEKRRSLIFFGKKTTTKLLATQLANYNNKLTIEFKKELK